MPYKFEPEKLKKILDFRHQKKRLAPFPPQLKPFSSFHEKSSAYIQIKCPTAEQDKSHNIFLYILFHSTGFFDLINLII